MKSTVVKKLKARKEWCCCRFKCNKPCAHHVFKSRTGWIKVRLTYLELWKLVKRYSWSFWRANDSRKGKLHALSGHKKRSKLCFVYLEVMLHQDRCAWCIYNLKNHQTVELRYSQANKQLPTYRWFFEMLKCSKNLINVLFRGCKPTRNVERMYLAVKKLKIKPK